MKYKLLCIDIDGTLLDDDKKLLPQVIDSLKKETAKGVRIALISGRMPAGVGLIEQKLGIQCVKACNAGSYILMGDKCISSRTLQPKTMKIIYNKIAKKNHLPLWVFHEEKWFVTDIDKQVKKEIEIIRYEPEVIDAEAAALRWEAEGIGPNKLLIAAESDKIPRLYEEIRDLGLSDIDQASSSDIFIEIFPSGVDKGEALREICRNLEIDRNEVVAFGDHELDIPLIEAAGIGIAMGNAIPELKEKADFVTKTNNEAGISYALEHYLTGE